MPDPQIAFRECLVSFIRHDVDLTLLRPGPSGTPYSRAFENKFTYQGLMQGLLEAPAAPGEGRPAGGLALPWTNLALNRFWKTYLSPVREEPLNGRLLARKLTPVHVRTRLSLEWAGPGGHVVSHQVFAHPYGVVVVTNVRLQGPLALTPLVQTVYGLPDAPVRLRSAEADPQDTTLGAAAGALLGDARGLLLGETPAGDAWEIAPVTVVTITAADGADVGQTPTDGGALHRGLWALTKWDTIWETVPLGPLAACRRKTRPLGDNCLLFAGRRGNQAVWCPSFLASDGQPSRSLVCYHRNQVANAVQIGSLARLTRAVRDVLAADALADYREMLAFCGDRAVDILGWAYDRNYDRMYHSGSTAALIDADPDLKDSIAAVRAALRGAGP